jgi:hypothetical protein
LPFSQSFETAMSSVEAATLLESEVALEAMFAAATLPLQRTAAATAARLLQPTTDEEAVHEAVRVIARLERERADFTSEVRWRRCSCRAV